MSAAYPVSPKAATDRWVVLGEISGVHGVAGWVKIFSFTDPPQGILEYSRWYLSGAGLEHHPVALRRGRKQGKGIVAQLDGCDDREQARDLIGSEIAVRRGDLPSVDAGEHYWADLIGLRVVTLEGTSLGIVEKLFDTGANDVVVVQGEREHLIPYLPGKVVRDIDLENGTMRVDWEADF